MYIFFFFFDEGGFTAEVPLVKGIKFKSADSFIIEHLKGIGRMIYSGKINYKYPFCYRTETPLIYRAIPFLFIKVEYLHEKFVNKIKSTYLVPKYVQEKILGIWFTNAKDWSPIHI